MGEKFDEFMWAWALGNVSEDYSEKNKLLMQVFDALKPWLSIELWNAEQKAKSTPTHYSTSYLDKLRARGATEEQLKPIVEDIERIEKESTATKKKEDKEDNDSQLRVIS